MLDVDGLICSWNRGAEKIKGYTAKEILGRHFSVFYSAEQITQGLPAHELKVAAESGKFADEGWRGAQGRLALLGQCPHQSDCGLRGTADRLFQDLSRPD